MSPHVKSNQLAITSGANSNCRLRSAREANGLILHTTRSGDHAGTAAPSSTHTVHANESLSCVLNKKMSFGEGEKPRTSLKWTLRLGFWMRAYVDTPSSN